MSGNKGFTLIELLMVISIIGILAAFSLPSFIAWTRNAQYKEAAQLAVSALRQGKGQAINLNQSVTVLFTLDDSAENDANKVKVGTGAEVFFKKGIEIKGGPLCDNDDGSVSIAFNPTGSSETGFICIFDGATKKYTIGISTANTGRILFERF